jgi:hypothetical protein
MNLDWEHIVKNVAICLRTFSFWATGRVELGRPKAFDRALELAPDFNSQCGHSERK